MKIRCVLENKDGAVYCIHPEETVFNCMKIFNSRRIGALVVINPDAEIVGIVTERDVMRTTWERRGDLEDLKVLDIMTPKKYLTTANIDDDVTDVMAVMSRKGVRHVPIVDENGLTGIMAITELVKTLYNNVKDEIKLMRTDRKKVSIIEMSAMVGSIADILRDENLKLATAESCTGGLIGATITELSGISELFNGAVVSYSNEVKIDILGVNPNSIGEFGAVSSEVASEMVRGVCSHLKSETGIAVTGIAGPGGGTDEKPVGLVYVATAVNGSVTVTENYFTGDRRDVRTQAVEQSLFQLLKHLRREL